MVSEEQCLTCSASTSCTRGSTSETPCNPGRFSANERQGTCEACEAGTFQDNEGQTGCKVCDLGDLDGYCPLLTTDH